MRDGHLAGGCKRVTRPAGWARCQSAGYGRLREALAPGGVLAIVGCYRQATRADYLPDLIAIPANRAADAAIKAIARHSRLPVPQVNTAPVAQPRITLSEINSEAQRLLPGAVIRRRLFWRYSLTYKHRPTTAR